MSEQIERWACVRESDHNYFLALKPPLPEYTPQFEVAQFGADATQIMEEGSQLFIYEKRENTKPSTFTNKVGRLIIDIDANLGPVAFDPERSHVSERKQPQPLPLAQL